MRRPLFAGPGAERRDGAAIERSRAEANRSLLREAEEAGRSPPTGVPHVSGPRTP